MQNFDQKLNTKWLTYAALAIGASTAAYLIYDSIKSDSAVDEKKDENKAEEYKPEEKIDDMSKHSEILSMLKED